MLENSRILELPGPFSIVYGTAYEVGHNGCVPVNTMKEAIEDLNSETSRDDSYWVLYGSKFTFYSEIDEFGAAHEHSSSMTELDFPGLTQPVFIQDHQLEDLIATLTEPMGSPE